MGGDWVDLYLCPQQEGGLRRRTAREMTSQHDNFPGQRDGLKARGPSSRSSDFLLCRYFGGGGEGGEGEGEGVLH